MRKSWWLFAIGVGGCHDSTWVDDTNVRLPADTAAAHFAWVEGPPCPLPRFEAMGAAVDGKLLVIGGFSDSQLHTTARVDAFDPAAATWTRMRDFPGAATTHGGVVVDGGTVWIVGGLLHGRSIADTWSYDAPSDVWQPRSPLPAPRSALAAALVGRELHAVGGLAADGTSDTGEHDVLDLDAPSNWTIAPAMPNPRNHVGGAAPGGLLIVVGGRHGWDEQAGDQNTVDAFDPVAGAWMSRARLPVQRSEIGASTFALDSRLVVIGGSLPGVHPSAVAWTYDPSADAWAALPSLPAPRKGAVAARVGSRIVVATGSPTSVDPSATTWIGCCLP